MPAAAPRSAHLSAARVPATRSSASSARAAPRWSSLLSALIADRFERRHVDAIAAGIFDEQPFEQNLVAAVRTGIHFVHADQAQLLRPEPAPFGGFDLFGPRE